MNFTGSRPDWRLYAVLTPLVACAALLGNWLCDAAQLGIDDAYIFFVYAKNFLISGEFVYNLGSERVEGYSSPLWMFICILASWLAAEPLIPLFFVSTLLSTSIIYQGLRYVRSATSDFDAGDDWNVPTWLFLGAMFAVPSWFMWNVASLMETSLWNALIASSAFLILRASRSRQIGIKQSAALSVLLGALVLTRPEAPLWVCWFLLAWFCLLRISGIRTGRPVLLALMPLLAALLAGAILVSTRYAYFGYPLANTYYAKMSPDMLYNLINGLGYLADYAIDNRASVPGLLISVWCFFRYLPYILNPASSQLTARKWTFDIWVLSGTVLAGLAVALITGGDKFGGYRYYQGIYPFIVLVTLIAAYSCAPRLNDFLKYSLRPACGIAAAVLSLAIISYNNGSGWDRPLLNKMWLEFDIAKDQEQIGRQITESFSNADLPIPAIGVIAAGGMKYAYDGEIVDLMGLNLTAMAHRSYDREGVKNHASFNKDVFYELRPPLVEPRRCLGEMRTPWETDSFESRAIKNLPDDPQFQGEYLYTFFRGKNQENWICAYVSLQLLDQIAATEAFEIGVFRNSQSASGAS